MNSHPLSIKTEPNYRINFMSQYFEAIFPLFGRDFHLIEGICLRGMFTSVLVLGLVLLHSGNFQQCTSELVNPLQPERMRMIKMSLLETTFCPFAINVLLDKICFINNKSLGGFHLARQNLMDRQDWA